MSGGIINTPCVNKSEMKLPFMELTSIWVLMQLEGLESKQHIASLQSAMNGEYQSLEDFINRIPIIEGIQILIFIGAFRFTTKTKNQLLVIASLILVNLNRKPAYVASRTS
jgi:DNA polymerase-3 subunit alpha/error-prone DNA polymerase